MGEAHAPSIPAVWCPEKWSTGAPHLRLSAAGEIELGNLRSIDPIHYALDLLKGHSDLLGLINFDISNISTSIMF